LYVNASSVVAAVVLSAPAASKEKPTVVFDEQLESNLVTCDFNKDQ
jgi:hypothetical protein